MAFYKPRPFPQPLPGVQNNAGPSLDLSFLTGTLDPRITTFTRASVGTYIDITGTRQTAANNVARFDYDPTLHTPRGMYSEGAVTQFLLNSATPVTQTITLSIVSTYTLWMEGSGSATVAAGTATGSGFGAATAGNPIIFTTTGAGTVTITVAGTVTVFQIERVGFATSFIPSAGTTAARQVDIASMPVSATWFRSASGTFVAEVMFYSLTSGTFLALSDGTTSNELFIQRNASGAVQAKMVLAGVTAQMTGAVAALNTPVKVAVSFTATTSTMVFNGGAAIPIAASSSAALWTIANLGCQAGGISQMWGWMRRVRFYPRALSTGEMQKVTT